nr:hypothetical protein [Streptomyces natalensis]
MDDDEGQRLLLRIIRRGTGSVVTWRRTQMVLLLAQGMPVTKIAEVSPPNGLYRTTGSSRAPASTTPPYVAVSGGAIALGRPSGVADVRFELQTVREGGGRTNVTIIESL